MPARLAVFGTGIVLLAGCSAGPLATNPNRLVTADAKLESGISNLASSSQQEDAPNASRQTSTVSVGPLFDLGSLHGLTLGAELSRTSGNHNETYQSRLSTGGTVSFKTWGLWGFAEYEEKGVIGGLDALIHLEGQTSGRRRRIYGLGNDTPYLETDIAGLGFPRIELEPSLGMTFDGGFSWRLGGTLRHTDLGPPHPADVAPAQNALEPEEFAPQIHAGGFLHLGVERVEGGAFPTRGFHLEGRGDVRAALVDSTGTYGALAGSGTVYLPLSERQPVVLALRIGGEHRIGDFPIYDAATVGGNTLRRFYESRFSGRTAAYGNAELRLRLLTLDVFPIPIDVGALAFADVGRVWVENETSNTWHIGGGGGLWLGLMHDLVGQGLIYSTEDGLGLSAGLGFRF